MKCPNCEKEILELDLQLTRSGKYDIAKGKFYVVFSEEQASFSDELRLFCPFCHEEIDEAEFE